MSDRDERIAGWLDGMLAPAEAAAFEAEMARDWDLAEQVAAWLQNDALLRAAMSGPIEQGVDEALLVRMNLARPVVNGAPAPVSGRLGTGAASAPANDNPAAGRILRRWAVPAGGLIAAGLALALVLPSERKATGDDFGDRLAVAMEHLPSRAEQRMPDGSRVSPVLSFAAADGRFCREFTLTGPARASGGIACKGAAGWVVEARSASGAAPADGGAIAVAAGSGGAALDAVYAHLGASDPLPVAEEQWLIASGWAARRPAGKSAE